MADTLLVRIERLIPVRKICLQLAPLHLALSLLCHLGLKEAGNCWSCSGVLPEYWLVPSYCFGVILTHSAVAAAVATYYQRRDDVTVNILSANPSRIELLDSIDIGFLVINLVTNLLLTSLIGMSCRNSRIWKFLFRVMLMNCQVAGRLRWTNMRINRTLKGFSQSNEPHFNGILETLYSVVCFAIFVIITSIEALVTLVRVESCLLYPITLVVSIVLKVYTITSDLDFLPILIQILVRNYYLI